MSKTAIVKFLAGSKPQSATLRMKLLPWYVRQAGALVDPVAAQAAITLLVNTTPEPQREDVRAGLLDLLREAHRRAGTEPPDWLK